MPQTRTDHVNSSQFAPAENIVSVTGFTFAQISGRDTDSDIEDLTLIAKNSDGKLIPLDDNTTIDGTQLPYGFLKGTIPAADIIDGDVTDVEVYVHGKYFDEDEITIEGSLTLASEITVDCYADDVSTADADEIATIASADATDLTSVVTLANEIKSTLNTYTSGNTASALSNAVKTAINTKTDGRKMTIREYLRMIGIFTRKQDAVVGYENS